MADQATAERAATVGRKRGFEWSGFFKSRSIRVQAFLYALLLYLTAPSASEMHILLLWLPLVPLSVLNMMGTHLVQELAAKHNKQA